MGGNDEFDEKYVKPGSAALKAPITAQKTTSTLIFIIFIDFLVETKL